jgi:hypothetical protein
VEIKFSVGDGKHKQMISQIGICRVRMCESYNTSQCRLGTYLTTATLHKNGDFEPGIYCLRQPYQSKHLNGKSTDDKPSVRTANIKKTLAGGRWRFMHHVQPLPYANINRRPDPDYTAIVLMIFALPLPRSCSELFFPHTVSTAHGGAN